MALTHLEGGDHLVRVGVGLLADVDLRELPRRGAGRTQRHAPRLARHVAPRDAARVRRVHLHSGRRDVESKGTSKYIYFSLVSISFMPVIIKCSTLNLCDYLYIFFKFFLSCILSVSAACLSKNITYILSKLHLSFTSFQWILQPCRSHDSNPPTSHNRDREFLEARAHSHKRLEYK